MRTPTQGEEDILRFLAKRNRPVTFAEIREATGCARATLRRIIDQSDDVSIPRREFQKESDTPSEITVCQRTQRPRSAITQIIHPVKGVSQAKIRVKSL